MLDGPTSGTTSIPLRCAAATRSAPSLANHADIVPGEGRRKHTLDSLGRRMLVEHVEMQAVNLYSFVARFEKTPGGAQLFYHEVLDLAEQCDICRRQDPVGSHRRKQ